jgi:hypothetical protein
VIRPVLAPLGNDRTFVTDAKGSGCDTTLYKFTINGQGKPVGLIPLAVPVLPGQPHPGSLTASSDGTMIGFDTQVCSYQHVRKHMGQVGVIDLATRHVTMWSYRFPATPVSLSMTANGAFIEIVSNPSGGKPELSMVRNAVWVVRTSAPPGPLGQRYRKLFGPPAWPTAAVLSPNGRLTWALEWSYVHTNPRIRVTLDAYQTATGKLLRSWHIFPRQSYIMLPSLSASVSGRYLLVFQFNNLVEKLDLATMRLTKVPGNVAYLPIDVAW